MSWDGLHLNTGQVYSCTYIVLCVFTPEVLTDSPNKKTYQQHGPGYPVPKDEAGLAAHTSHSIFTPEVQIWSRLALQTKRRTRSMDQDTLYPRMRQT